MAPDDAGPRAKVLLLGTFHFHNPGLDVYRSDHEVDMLSAERQRQISDVVACLARFAPTKVAVEVRAEGAERLQREYEAYRGGRFVLTANEIHQLGFRVAAGAGNDRLYPIDDRGLVADDSQFEPLFAYARTVGRGDLVDDPLDPEFKRIASHYDRLRVQLPLREFYRVTLAPGYLESMHGLGYFEGWFRLRDDTAFPGPDLITTWHYGRNLRIFANLQRITESADDRILVIYGSGHVAVLRHCLQCSPEHELVEIAEYL